ncbi:MAG: sulfatase [Planctomycetota bacterium]|nr:sulfatase [Planctomycetota bacterium]
MTRSTNPLASGFGRAAFLALAFGPTAGCGAEPGSGQHGLQGSLVGKHVLITLIDACAIDHLSMYGYERDTTPFLARLAEESLVFEDVTAPAPYTIASVASLMTGEAVDVHGVTEAGREVSAELPMLAERFAQAGYQTNGLSANAHIQRAFGFARGFDSYDGFWPDIELEHRVPLAQSRRARKVLEDAAQDPRPLFAYWHFLPPHAPYDPPTVDRASFAGHLVGTPLDEAGSLDNLMPLSYGARQPGAPEAQAIEDLYDASLRHVDAQLAAISQALEDTGLADDTLWIVVSDHGEAFGQHGLWQHARTVHDEMVRVPLIVHLPKDLRAKIPPGRRTTPVGLADLHPTLVQLCELGGDLPWSSASLVDELLATGPPPAADLADRPPIVTRTAGPAEHVAIRDGQLKLIHRLSGFDEDGKRKGEGTWELYDLAADPAETKRLPHNQPAHAEDFARLRKQLRLFREAARARAKAATEVEVDAATEAHLTDIGY